ncbi:phenylalanine--tRNA ligase subunit alpha [bacterium]|nr:phenylalanine--tRNA ligase subunit alpha [bacterium]
MKEKIEKAYAEIKATIPQSEAELEELRIKLLGKKGLIPGFYAQLKEVPNEQKKEFGALINNLKTEATDWLENLKTKVVKARKPGADDGTDMTLPANFLSIGGMHPLSIVRQELINIFGRIGFDISEGNEVVDEWTNFTALNMPHDHPARDMQDTFFVKNLDQHVLRTHTSGVQVQEMLKGKLPIRTISPGMVFRKDNDATHSPFFHQIEGLYIDEKVSFKDLKQTLYYFVKEQFGEGTKFRLRPSYFPFTEPSAEMDIEWNKNGESSWMEILGCGMVDPAVLDNCGIDSKKYSGFAFGIGVERIAMLKYGINDIRVFYENDIRFLKQFIPA